MRKLTLLSRLALLALVAACAAPPPAPLPYRSKTTAIYSSAAFEPARFAGPWHEVAGFFDPKRQSCSLGLTRVERDGDGLRFSLAGCGDGGARTVPVTRIAAAEGRFQPQIAGPRGEPWWVLWVDSDYRTMVVGTPSGDFGAILARPGPVNPDRLEAARQVLNFNGYDTRRMVRE